MSIPVNEFITAFNTGFRRVPSMPAEYARIENERLYRNYFGQGESGVARFGDVAHQLYLYILLKLDKIATLYERPVGTMWRSYSEFVETRRRMLRDSHVDKDITRVQTGRPHPDELTSVRHFVQTIVAAFAMYGWQFPEATSGSKEAQEYNRFVSLVGTPLQTEYKALMLRR